VRRILIEVSYDGTEYVGWQVQPNGITIESVLNETLSAFFKEEIKVIGASRTDSGVHALSAMAVFDTNASMPAEKVAYAINTRLPEDIVIQRSRQVPLDFHPRYAASEKTYEYKILNRKIRIPNMRRDSYFFYRDLNVEAMQKAASYLLGEHDFISFASPHFTAKTTVRTLYECSVKSQPLGEEDSLEEGRVITIRVRGNGFLYNMVRIIAGTLIQVGCGFYKPEQIKEMLEAKTRDASGQTAPAHGLTLVKTEFLEEIPEG
jgi:tRNA pseudouridine38-40 synthase